MVKDDEGSPTGLVRRTLTASRDPRVARTRAAIVDAVTRLAHESAEPITVADVVRAAGVSRSSFYAHFAGLDELARFVGDQAFAGITASYRDDVARAQSPHAAMRLSQARLVEHYVRYRALYRAVVALPSPGDSLLTGVRAMAELIEETLRDLPGRPAAVEPRIAGRYIAGAAFGLLDAWTRGEVDATPEQIVDHLLALMPPWLSAEPAEPGPEPPHPHQQKGSTG